LPVYSIISHKDLKTAKSGDFNPSFFVIFYSQFML